MDDLVARYNKIKTDIESLKVAKIKEETTLENLKTQQATLLTTILAETKAANIEEVPAIIEKLDSKITDLVNKAEALLKEV